MYLLTSPIDRSRSQLSVTFFPDSMRFLNRPKRSILFFVFWPLFLDHLKSSSIIYSRKYYNSTTHIKNWKIKCMQNKSTLKCKKFMFYSLSVGGGLPCTGWPFGGICQNKIASSQKLKSFKNLKSMFVLCIFCNFF